MRIYLAPFVIAAALPTLATAGTVTVNALTDDGPGDCSSKCTLRDALLSASPTDTIVFSSSLPYPSTLVLNGNELYAFRNVTIVGPGIDNLAISGNDASRIMEVDAGANAALSGLTFKNGFNHQSGGAFFVHAGSSLTLSSTLLTANRVAAPDGDTAFASGGAIYADGSVTITDSILNANEAIGGRGADLPICSDPILERAADGSGAEGGAIATASATEQLVLSNVVFSNNTATGGIGGNAPKGSACGAGNGGAAYGGGIWTSLAFIGFVTAEGNAVVPGTPGSGGEAAAAGNSAAADLAVGRVYVHNTVLIGGSGAHACDGEYGPIIAGQVYTWGSNFDDDSSCPGFDRHGDAQLRTTDAHHLQLDIFPAFGSPLIDAASDCLDAQGYTIDHDVLGNPRPSDGNLDSVAQCDIGAVEYTDFIFANGFE